MNRKEKIDYLKGLPLEERAKNAPKELSCFVALIIILLGIISGLYYWFISDFIISYKTISPFWGFVIFTCLGISIYLLNSIIYMSFWKEYNEIIEDANEEIKSMIDQGVGSTEQLEKMKIAMIERQIGTDQLSQDNFEWHSKRVCWGCGKQHTDTPKLYRYDTEKTETWKEGAYRKTQTFKTSAYILLCTKCHARLSKAKTISEKNDEKRNIIKWIIVLIVTISFFIFQNNISGNSFGDVLLYTIICFGVASSIGLIVIYPLAYLLSLPYTQKGGDDKTKWDFENIPQIWKFRNTNQHTMVL